MALSLRHIPRRLRQAWDEGAIALKAISFGLIGVINTLVDIGLFSLGFYYFGLPIVAANIISWAVAVSGSYVMNSMVTFAQETGRQLGARKYAAFVVMQVAGLIANTATVWTLVHVVELPALLAKILSVGVSFAVNFSLTHYVVFRKRS